MRIDLSIGIESANRRKSASLDSSLNAMELGQNYLYDSFGMPSSSMSLIPFCHTQRQFETPIKCYE
eukprot:1221846-Ditylum_brightwellii.AAC.1